jgi:uncharacterized membrane protein
MQLINHLKSRGGRAKRYDLFWEIGPSVDLIAAALIQKGIVERVKEGRYIVYKLTRFGDV